MFDQFGLVGVGKIFIVPARVLLVGHLCVILRDSMVLADMPGLIRFVKRFRRVYGFN